MNKHVVGSGLLLIFCSGLLFAAPKSQKAARRAALAKAPLALRARVINTSADTPDEYYRIHWRYGGEGQTAGDVVHGEVTAVLPIAPKGETAEVDLADDSGIPDIVDRILKDEDKKGDIFIEPGKTYDYYWLRKGIWSPPGKLSELRSRFITFTIDKKSGRGSGTMTNVVVEFELSFNGQPIKTFTETGDDGPTAGIFMPGDRIDDNANPSASLLGRMGGLLQYSTHRAEMLESLPWARQPVPKLYAILTDCGGYGARAGYGCRTSSKDVMMAEYRSLRQLGVNGLRGGSETAFKILQERTGSYSDFARVRDSMGPGYICPAVEKDKEPPPGAGCPYYPDTVANIPARVQAYVDKLIQERAQARAVGEWWVLTVDEIGSVFGRAPEKTQHIGCCPHCREAFRDYVKKFGLTLKDFGAPSWDDVRPTLGYWSKTYAQVQAELALNPAAADLPVLWEDLEEGEGAIDLGDEEGGAAKEDESAKEEKKKARGAAGNPTQPHNLSARGWRLMHYYSRRFINDSSAKMFTPLRNALEKENATKKKALAEGKTNSPEAIQPWIYCYALRGNTFLMGGSSLDFFDFYRLGDNGFMYETSNRDPRVWEWDSYLCDVGRTLKEKLGTKFGIYIKPHRGAPIQRLLSAVGHGCETIFWYTYGPEWSKGDSFAGNSNTTKRVSQGMRIVAAAEHVTYNSAYAHPPETAIVRPRTSEFWDNTASWENGKWIYEALVHSHIPMDVLDEELVMSEDLKPYKAIYVSGANLRANVAAKLAKWVEEGGVLYVNGGGSARDEANDPLADLQKVLGLQSRNEMELWGGVRRYGATGLPGIGKERDVPEETATVVGQGLFDGSFLLKVGREVLDPAPGTEVVAKYGDGKAAATMHPHGKGKAYVVGFYPGMEYASDVMKTGFDMSTDFQAGKRDCIGKPARDAGVLPVVDASYPIVEGILLKNRETGKMAASLMNWAYKGKELVRLDNVTVKLRGTGSLKSVTSAGSGESLAFEQKGADVLVKIPQLEAGDILLLD